MLRIRARDRTSFCDVLKAESIYDLLSIGLLNAFIACLCWEDLSLHNFETPKSATPGTSHHSQHLNSLNLNVGFKALIL